MDDLTGSEGLVVKRILSQEKGVTSQSRFKLELGTIDVALLKTQLAQTEA